MKIQIRFNTEKERTDPGLPAWRVLEDGCETLATHIEIRVPAFTSEDVLPSGVRKWHISCEGRTVWEENKCTIVPSD